MNCAYISALCLAMAAFTPIPKVSDLLDLFNLGWREYKVDRIVPISLKSPGQLILRGRGLVERQATNSREGQFCSALLSRMSSEVVKVYFQTES